jgi:hypothetical protein
MNYLVNLFKKVFFGKTHETKKEVQHKCAEVSMKPTVNNHAVGGRLKIPRVPMQNFGHNNRKTTEARRVQFIHQKDGTTKTIFHSSYTS